MVVPHCIFGANKKAELSLASIFDPPPYSLENTSFGEVVLHYPDPFPFVQRSNPKKNIVYGTLYMPELTTTSPYVHSRVDLPTHLP